MKRRPPAKSLRTPQRRLCASLRSRNPFGHLPRAIWCENLQAKCCAPGPGQPFCASLRSRNHVDISEEHVAREFTGKMLRPRAGTTGLCEPAKAKCIWTSEKSRFLREFRGKMPGPKIGGRLCASLRNRNAHGHVTRAILCENLQEECRAAPKMEHPDQALALTPAVRP